MSEVQQRLSSAHAAAEAARDAAHRESVRAESLAAEKRLLVASEQRAAAQVTRCTPRALAALARMAREGHAPHGAGRLNKSAVPASGRGAGSGCRAPCAPTISGDVL